ncbi:MAG TPA: DUF2255 family protein [Candidatus Sulfotelmatobacter sp.]|nr:DUF2255 family protein [Candidatus Sulfotelmatobacter sp.]
MTLPPDVLAACADEMEIEVVTTRPDGTLRRTVVWPVVEEGVAYLRSYRGPHGRWYQEAVANPEAALVVGGRDAPVRLLPATDPTSIAACSAALVRKYAADGSLAAMLVDDVLPTTLLIEPR